jgi:hypothetical protein
MRVDDCWHHRLALEVYAPRLVWDPHLIGVADCAYDVPLDNQCAVLDRRLAVGNDDPNVLERGDFIRCLSDSRIDPARGPRQQQTGKDLYRAIRVHRILQRLALVIVLMSDGATEDSC